MNSPIMSADRRYFIGGSDARTIMGDDEAALIRLWKEKRGEVEPEDLSGNLIVQLGRATEKLNRRWYQANSGAGRHRRPNVAPTPNPPLDGGNPRRSGRRRRCVRVQIHAALAILGGGCRSEARRATATQYVGRSGQGGGTFGDHRRRQVGGNQNPRRSALPTSHRHCRAQILALR